MPVPAYNELSPDPFMENPAAWKFHQDWIHDGAMYAENVGSGSSYTYPVVGAAGMGLVGGNTYTLTVDVESFVNGPFGGRTHISLGSEIKWRSDVEGAGTYSYDVIYDPDVFGFGLFISVRQTSSAIINGISIIDPTIPEPVVISNSYKPIKIGRKHIVTNSRPISRRRR